MGLLLGYSWTMENVERFFGFEFPGWASFWVCEIISGFPAPSLRLGGLESSTIRRLRLRSFADTNIQKERLLLVRTDYSKM